MVAAIAASSKDHLFAIQDDLLIALWHDRTTLEGVALGQRLCDELAERYPDGILLLTIVGEQAKIPSSAERAAVAQLLERGEGRTKRSAVVYEGQGFRAATIRSVVTSMLLFSRPTFPHRVFAHVDEASAFLADAEGCTLLKRQIVECVHEVRTRYLKVIGAIPF